MARMIPPECPPNTKSEGEKRLFARFRDQLPASCTVFHQFKMLTSLKTRKGHTEAEADFLVYCPKRGFLVVEVKGGTIRYEGGRAQWTQNGDLMDSPFVQAQENKHKLRKFLEKSLGRKPLPFSLGFAVAFPDISEKPRAMPTEALPEITLARDDCEYVEHAVDALFAHYALPEGKPDQPALSQAFKILTRDFEFTARQSDQLEVIKNSIHRLTEEQCRVLELLSHQREALIDGCAGSGKTIMALKKARQLAREGKRVLLLCFNELLSRHLAKVLTSEKSEEVRKNISCSTFHNFCLETLKKAGLPVTLRPDDSDFWNEELPGLAGNCLDVFPQKYDAIIVDEAQDFREDFWLVVEELRKKGGYFYVFRDPRQDLFNRGAGVDIPIKTPPFVLNTNCRNTRHIGDMVSRLSSREVKTHDAAPEGMKVIRHNCANDAEVRARVEATLNELTVKQGFKTNQIVILGARSMKNTSLGADGHLGRYLASENGKKSGPMVVHYYTYMKFKGLESDAVIVVDVNPQVKRWQSRRGLYTAVSRAVSVLAVVYTR